jgi:dephospho-CoA kinase
VGKSQVAAVLRELGVGHVNADELVLDLLAKGTQPHPDHRRLAAVEAAIAERSGVTFVKAPYVGRC